MTKHWKLLVGGGVLLPLQIVAAVLARRDLAKRSDAEVRWGRRFWSRVIWMNPGNAFAYWILGRKQVAPAAQ